MVGGNVNSTATSYTFSITGLTEGASLELINNVDGINLVQVGSRYIVEVKTTGGQLQPPEEALKNIKITMPQDFSTNETGADPAQELGFFLNFSAQDAEGAQNTQTERADIVVKPVTDPLNGNNGTTWEQRYDHHPVG